MPFELGSVKLNISGGMLLLSIEAKSSDGAPRLGVIFSCSDKTRRLPLIRESADGGARYHNEYLLSEVFYKFKAGDTKLFLTDENGKELFISENNAAVSCGGVKYENGGFIIDKALMNKKTRRPFKELIKKETAVRLIFKILNSFFKVYKSAHPVVANRVAFMSGRRTSLDGNMSFVYDKLKSRKGVEIKTLLFTQSSGLALLKNSLAFMKLYATSRAVVVDDYFRLLNYFDKGKDTKVFQLWHACGAFKTFGYSRLGKPGAPSQREPNHRMYDLAIVSSAEVARHYAEGFGISDGCVVSTGVPRCDAFFDEEYKAETKRRLYYKYPQLKDKRVLLFAPTFRGNGQQSAYYPTDRIDINKLCASIGEEWAVIVKLHPFCRERLDISKAEGTVIDLSDEDELNDLLFITDLLVTDYSSAVFEASLLDIPMLFYCFDLEEYISGRDFYYSFNELAPGRAVRTEAELIESINGSNFDEEKIKGFRQRFFDYTDSGSSQRTADEITKYLEVV